MLVARPASPSSASCQLDMLLLRSFVARRSEEAMCVSHAPSKVAFAAIRNPHPPLHVDLWQNQKILPCLEVVNK
jgi:hypothetical protein